MFHGIKMFQNCDNKSLSLENLMGQDRKGGRKRTKRNVSKEKGGKIRGEMEVEEKSKQQSIGCLSRRTSFLSTI